MRISATRGPLHKTQVLNLKPLLNSLQVYSSTHLLVPEAESCLLHMRHFKREKGFHLPGDVKTL